MIKLKLDIQKFASGTITFANDDIMSGKIIWSSVVQGSTIQEKAQLNKSKVTAILYVQRNDGGHTWGDFTGQIGMSGTTSSVFHPDLDLNNYNWVEVGRYEKEVPHNADGSKTIAIDGWITAPSGTTMAGLGVSGSGGCVLDKIPRYATCNQSLNTRTETTIKMNWSSDSTCDYIWYSINNGSSWTAVGSINTTSGNYTISGLTANTPYQIKTKVRRKDSQLTTESSSSLPVTTHPYPYAETLPAFIIGGNPTIGIKNPLNRTFSITVYGADNSVIYTGSNKTGTSITNILNGQTEVDNLYQSIPNTTSGKYKVKIDTTLPSSTTIQSTNLYSVDEDECRPTFNNFTYVDANATTTALTGDSSIIVQNYSNVRATISTANKAVAKHSATMVKYDLIIPGNVTNSENYSDNSDVVITTNGAKSGIIKVSAEDSRKIPKVVEKTLDSTKFKAYTNIQKNEINVVRTGNVGTGVTLTYNGTLWGQSFGSVTNTAKSARYRYKKTSDADYSGWNGTTTITPTTNGNNYSFSGGIAGDLGNTGFSAEYSFNIEVEVFDELSSTVFSFVLGTGVPHIAVADDGIAIKQPYDTNVGGALQINGATTINGQTKILGTAGSKPLMTRGIVGSNTDCTAIDDLYLQYGASKSIYLGNAGGYTISADGSKYSGKSALSEKLETINGRITNANITHTYENDKAHMQLLQSSGSMTSNKPSADGYILHFSWDNGSAWDGQLYIPNTNTNVPMQFRGCANGTWGSWEDVYRCKSLYDNSTGVTGNVTLSETSANFKYLEIFFYGKIGGKSIYNSTKVYSPNGKQVSLMTANAQNNAMALAVCLKTISGTTMTNNYNGTYMSFGAPGGTNEIYVYKVVGYR